MTEQETYKCEVQEVFSGDDLIAMVDLGVEGLWKRQRIRLAGVDTPPAIKATWDTEPGQVRTMVRNLVRLRKAKIQVVSKNTNSWVVNLIIDSPNGDININELLMARGYKFNKVEKLSA